VIVVDTTVLVYSVGDDHALREPCRRVVEAAAAGHIEATTTAEVVQEFVHVRARRRDRREAARLGSEWVDLLAPLMALAEDDLRQGLALFQKQPSLGSFDAVLAAAAMRAEADALVSADAAFAALPKLRHVDPRDPALASLIGAGG
jgi:uncharacterized protein